MINIAITLLSKKKQDFLLLCNFVRSKTSDKKVLKNVIIRPCLLCIIAIMTVVIDGAISF